MDWKVLSLGVVLGLQDGILNPCTLSVIVLLLIYLSTRGAGKKRLLLCGISFSLGVFLIYFIFLEGLIFAFLKIPEKYQLLLNNTLGILLILFGILEIKDFFLYGKGISLKIPTKVKRKFEVLLKAQTAISAFLLGFLAGSAEIPCAGIYPPTYARAVTLLSASMIEASLYVLWYMFWFVFPLVIILLTSVYGILGTEKWRSFYERYKKGMRLVSGIIMLILGITMITGWFARLIS